MRTIPLLVPDELANLVRSIAQQDAGELEQDDFNHGHGVCEWVTASDRKSTRLNSSHPSSSRMPSSA